MDKVTYVLCSVTSLICCLLLARAYLATRTRLLLASALCFLCFAVENAIVFADLVVFTGVDLSPFRYGIALLGICSLLYGLIWESSQ